jgi:hypothetical protein
MNSDTPLAFDSSSLTDERRQHVGPQCEFDLAPDNTRIGAKYPPLLAVYLDEKSIPITLKCARRHGACVAPVSRSIAWGDQSHRVWAHRKPLAVAFNDCLVPNKTSDEF